MPSIGFVVHLPVIVVISVTVCGEFVVRALDNPCNDLCVSMTGYTGSGLNPVKHTKTKL